MRLYKLKYFITGLFVSIIYVLGGTFCYAQDINLDAKEIESLKLKTGQLISHEEIRTSNLITSVNDLNTEIIYSYIGNEVENASNIVFTGSEKYSNTEKIDDTHYRIYSSPRFFKDDDNFIHKIELGQTTKEIWDEASVPTLMDKITSILKTPYANAGTSYGTNDNYLATYRTTSWYDVRTATTADAYSSTIVAFNWYQTFEIDPTIYYNFRTPIDFDLTLINSENILSGSINLYASADTDAGDLHSYGFYKGTQAFPATVDDYNNYENLQYTDIIDNEDIVNSAFNSWTLNNDGIEYLKTGVSSFMFMEATYDVGSSTPPDYSTISFGRSFTNSLGENLEQHPFIELEVSETGTSTVGILNCDDMMFNQKCVITTYNYDGTKLASTSAVTTYNFFNFLFFVLELLLSFSIIVGLIKFKR